MSVHVIYTKDNGYQIIKVVIFGCFEAPPPDYAFDDSKMLRAFIEPLITRALGLPSLEFLYQCIVPEFFPGNDRPAATHCLEKFARGAFNTTKDQETASKEAYFTLQIDGENVDG